MGKSSDRQNDNLRLVGSIMRSKDQLDFLFAHLRIKLSKRERISLFAAAQMSGFWSYGIGWSWDEFDAPWDQHHTAIKDVAELTKSFRHELLATAGQNDASQGSDSTEAAAGRVARGREVESRLAYFVRKTKLVPLISTDLERWERMESSMAERDGLWMSASGSLVSFQPLPSGWFCAVKPQELINLLGTRPVWKKRASETDWVLIEAIARHLFETKGYPLKLREYAEEAMRLHQLARQLENEPDFTAVMGVISRLANEYRSQGR